MNKHVYIISDNGEIKQVDCQDLFDQFARKTTTPFGVGRVDFYRKINGYETYLTGRENLDEQAEWFDSYTDAVESAADYNEGNKNEPAFKPRAVREAIRIDLRSYIGRDGSSCSHRFVETEAEAVEWLNECARFDFFQNTNAPLTFATLIEAEAFLRDQEI